MVFRRITEEASESPDIYDPSSLHLPGSTPDLDSASISGQGEHRHIEEYRLTDFKRVRLVETPASPAAACDNRGLNHSTLAPERDYNNPNNSSPAPEPALDHSSPAPEPNYNNLTHLSPAPHRDYDDLDDLLPAPEPDYYTLGNLTYPSTATEREYYTSDNLTYSSPAPGRNYYHPDPLSPAPLPDYYTPNYLSPAPEHHYHSLYSSWPGERAKESAILCQNCNKILTGPYASGNLTRHHKSRSCAASKKRKVFICDVEDCLKQYERSDALLNHTRKKHGPPKPSR